MATTPTEPVAAALTEPEIVQERSLRSDVLLMAVTKFLGLVLGVVTSIVLARGLGTSGRGTMAVAFNMTLVLVQLGTLGINTANPYYVSKEPGSTGRIVVNAVVLSVVLGVLLGGAGLAVRALAPDVVKGVTWVEALVAFAAIPSTLGALFLQSVLLGLGRTLAYNLVEAITGAGAAVALILGFLAFDMGVVGALSVIGIQHLAAMGAYLVCLRRETPRSSRPSIDLARRMMGYGFRIYVAALMGFLVIRIDTFLVNGILGADEAGRYSVAVALADGMALLPLAVAFNLFPRIARGGDTQISVEVFRTFAVLFGAMCLFTVPLAGLAIGIMFGPEYEEATSLYFWLLPGIWSLGMLTILAHHFAGRGFPLEAMLVWFAGIGVNLAINIVFLHNGTWVAAMSSSVAYGLLLFLHVRMLAKETGYRALRPRIGEAARMVRSLLSRSAPA